MKKFRIAVSDVVVIADVTAPPSATTLAWFDSVMKDEPEDSGRNDAIKELELSAHNSKTFSYLRLRELLLQNSADANLVVM